MGTTVVTGDGELVDAACIEFARSGCTTIPVPASEADAELPHVIMGAERVVIATRSDALALRLVLLARDRAPEVDIVVTVFDRTLADELGGPDLRCRVVASAQLVANVIAGPCADGSIDALQGRDGALGTITAGDELTRASLDEGDGRGSARSPLDLLLAVARPYDTSAKILVTGLAGLLLMLLIDTVIGLTALHEDLPEALFHSTRILTTVDGNPHLAEASDAIQLASVLTMLGTLVSLALFSAGLVSRIVEPRNVGIVGRRALPRRDHVVIVGMGQIGLRTALLLRSAGVAVVGVDRDPLAIGVRLGGVYGLPIVIANGEDRSFLASLHVGRARAVAAVTSDDLVNIEVAMAARAVRPQTRVVLRAGDGEIARETRSLLHLGVVRDAHRVVALGLVAATLRGVPEVVVIRGGEPGGWVVLEDGAAERWPPSRAG